MTLRSKTYLKSLLVGVSGVGVNYIVYTLSLKILSNFSSWMLGIIIASITNYIFNARWTFKKDVNSSISGFTYEELVEINEFINYNKEKQD